ncbi:MAG: hypothetical protein QW343_02000 [Candidatus Norongarragalinales archaeon]
MKSTLKILLIVFAFILALLIAGCVERPAPFSASPSPASGSTPNPAPSAASLPAPSLAPNFSPSAAASVASASVEASAQPSPWPSAALGASSQAVSVSGGAPSLEELAKAIETIASNVLGVTVKISKINDRMWATADYSRPVTYEIYVEYPIVNEFDAADYVLELAGPKTNASKKVAVLYGKIASAYFDYNVKQFCFGKRVMVTTKIREPLYGSREPKNYGKTLAEQIIDVCPS